MEFRIGTTIEPEFIELINSIPEALLNIEGIKKIDPFELAEDYFEVPEVADMSIDPNANVNGKSPVNFHSEIFKPQLKLQSYYLLWKKIKNRYGLDEANRITEAMIDGLLYCHDLTKISVPYCFFPDVSFLAVEGRPYGWLPSAQPKKMRSYMGQLREVTMDFSQENAGACSIANALINMAYYTAKERRIKHMFVSNIIDSGMSIDNCIHSIVSAFSANDDYYEKNLRNAKEMVGKDRENLYLLVDYLYDKEIEDEIQQTIHIFHNTFRIGGDSPFTNISLFDRPTIETVFKDAMYPDGSSPLDNIEEIMRVQKIYAEFFAKGSPLTGKPYRFPVTTVNIKTDEQGKIIDKDFFYYIVDLNREKCVFNFHKGEKLAGCCRLNCDLADLKEQIRMDSFGNGGLSIGSHRVITINLHRVALMVREARRRGAELCFKDVLYDALNMAEKVLVVHKEDILKDYVEKGFLKFFNIGWVNLNMFFSTFGFTGLYDAYRYDGNDDVEDYTRFAQDVLSFMDNYAREAGRRNKGFAFNVEEIPGEGASPKLAAKDRLLFGTDLKLLSNQVLPLYEDHSFFDRLKVAGKLMDSVSGGSILHINVSDELTVGANRELMRRLIEEYNIPHFALNKGFSTCVEGHTSVGIHQECPECRAEIDTYTTRVVGFFTDTKDWVKARREWEFPQRRWYGKDELEST